MFRPLTACILLLLLLCCAARADVVVPVSTQVIVSVRDQKMMVVNNGKKIATYPISTSKFGLGDRLGSMATPLGYMQVVRKIGDNFPLGAVFHNRRFTGEILKPNAPGRDPIVTRIIWLRGLEAGNEHAFGRCIYIHGTAEERTIGRPASYGCIRMKSKDVALLYSQLPLGALVQVIPDKLPNPRKVTPPSEAVIATAYPPQQQTPAVTRVAYLKPPRS